MKRTSWIVSNFGIRPNGSPEHCFYCQQPRGTEHTWTCVIRSRTVVVRTIVEHVIDVPEDWTGHDLHVRYNEGTWCGDNFEDEFHELVERLDAKGSCTCDLISREYVREATAEDEDASAVFVEEIKS